MIITTIILAEGEPPYRAIWEGELPEVPLPGEPLAFNAHQYQVMERSWRFGAAPIDINNLDLLNNAPKVVMGCGLLVIDPTNPPAAMIPPLDPNPSAEG